MPQMRINLEEKSDKNLRLYMAKHGITDKRDAVNEILRKLKV